MKISGFSFVRNGSKLYYPVKESIKSILPICDEFIVAVGAGDKDDKSREEIESIGGDKVKIIDTVWDEKYCVRGAIHSVQTDIAKKACSGDWLFYLQADEVVHEDDLPIIHNRCEELLENRAVEGLLFKYIHFWGDYFHFHKSHGWYPYEIRIIRNLPEIRSFESAQSFRHFDYWEHPRQPKGTRKLRVAPVNARIFHYGWTRPPHLMQNKRKYFDKSHLGAARAEQRHKNEREYFDFGPLDRLEKFTGTHPAVMLERIKSFDWGDKLQYSGKPSRDRAPHKHEKLRVKLLSWIEKNLNGGRQIFTFKNYKLIKGV